MLKSWILRYQLKHHWPSATPVVTEAQLLKLAEAKQIIFHGESVFLHGISLVQQYFAVQDQTFATKQNILQLAASLAEQQDNPLFGAIVKAAKELGLTLREIDVDQISDLGITGKLDRTWYILGDDQCMELEQIELGVTIKTLAYQFEQEGKYTFFIAQKQPKRLLGIFAVAQPISENSPEVLLGLRAHGLEMTLITDLKQNMARGLGKQLGINAVHGGLNNQEQLQLTKSLVQAQPNTVIVTNKSDCQALQTRFPEAVVIILNKRKGDSEGYRLNSLEALCMVLESAERIIERVQKYFFWIKFT